MATDDGSGGGQTARLTDGYRYRAPGRFVGEHGVENRQELTHASHQRHLRGFASRQEPLVELLITGL